MGLFEILFPKKKNPPNYKEFFETLTTYSPTFSSYSGGIYEMLLVRSCIHKFATDCSKAIPALAKENKEIEYLLKHKPNTFTDINKFIYRIATILACENNAFIIPILDENQKITGLFPIIPSNAELVTVDNTLYIRYTFSNGKRGAIEYSKVAHLTEYQFKSDFFGQNNDVLKPTIDMLHTENEGIINAIKSSATIRFLGKISQQMDDEDLIAERKNFSDMNLSSENDSQMILYDSRFSELKQVESKPLLLDDKQKNAISNNVFLHFNMSEKIVTNSYSEDEWNAYYEGKIEPFLIKLSIALTNMLFDKNEVINGQMVYLSSNRMQYASNKTKLEISTQLFDRGLINGDQVADIWNMEHWEGGNKRYIRAEYIDIETLGGNNNAKTTE